MHVRLIAVGDKQPAWVVTAFDDYCLRFPHQWKFTLNSVATARRNKGELSTVAKEAEGAKILAKLKPADCVVALDESGKQESSKSLAVMLDEWQTVGADLVFVIGGPDGLSPNVLQRANRIWSLSKLTLPHGLARVLFAEQLYRAYSMLSGHPYHRE
ncbi:MAG: 23S rRNA (pseudouridine(1915)-N(3))-methyltransferase RlmH [Woeseiaceae bacterium]|jgi:23S rRNA (pseudouridine1915-N3)-methyltransferase|nr:23S rRNA (pseudouridine(1915)-N(3))-methyltransferase RlmH [Woeseiaceae bacterium]